MPRIVAFAALLLAALLTSALSPPRQQALESLASPAAPGATEPNLTVAPDGRVYMSWLEPTPDSAFALRVATLDGSRWSTPQTIRAGRDFFVNWADFPSIKVLGNGSLAVHWLQRAGPRSSAYGIRLSLSADGGKNWSAPITPHRDSANAEHGFVALWPDNRSLGVVWLDGRKFDKAGPAPTNEMAVLATSVSETGALGSEVPIDPRACDCCQVSAAVTSAGPIVAYRDRTADEIRDIVVVRRVAGRWTAPAPVHADGWRINACPVNGPSVAANGSRVAVAWFTAANDSARVKVAFSTDAGATFGAPVRIDQGNPAGRVDVALMPDGSALVSWIERTGGDAAVVRARRVGTDGRAGTVVNVATSTAARASGFPRMAIAGTRVIFAWTVPGRPSEVRLAHAATASFR